MDDPALLTAFEALGAFGIALVIRYILPHKKNGDRGPALTKGGPRFA